MASLNEQIKRAESKKKRRKALNKVTSLKIKNLQLKAKIKELGPIIALGSFIINNFNVTDLNDFKANFNMIRKDNNTPDQFNNKGV